MATLFCPSCRLEQPVTHSYCVRCGTDIPVHLLDEHPVKRARWFAGVKVHPEEPEGTFLRVACYLTEQRMDAPEGTAVVPGRHVRFSVWDGERARCVVSIPEAEAAELARFITKELRQTDARLADR